jgi:7-cyano-7-deazaguanine synthase
MIQALLASPLFAGRVEPLAIVEFGMRDVYAPTHWAIRGVPPAYDTPDEDVYLAGRNLVLLTKAGVIAAARNLSRIVLGPLADNPFPDATPEFFQSMARTLSLGLNHVIEIDTPFAGLHKDEVIRLGQRLGVPLELTLSCMNPVDAPRPLHCGVCSKCRERRDAFAAAEVIDATAYAFASPR